jgi:hypothetical protein
MSDGPRPLSAWLGVLAQMEESLNQSLALAAEPPAQRPAQELQSPLRALDERLAAWQAELELTERNATEAETQVAAEAQALENWCLAVKGASQKLAACTQAGLEGRPTRAA